jgi:hypothetical protein
MILCVLLNFVSKKLVFCLLSNSESRRLFSLFDNMFLLRSLVFGIFVLLIILMCILNF